MSLSRREFVLGGLQSGAWTAIAPLSEPGCFQFRHQAIHYPDLPAELDGFTFVQRSDAHLDHDAPVVIQADKIRAGLVASIKDMGVDLEDVLLVDSGDAQTVDDRHQNGTGSAEVFLQTQRPFENQLAAKIFVPGNHDFDSKRRLITNIGSEVVWGDRREFSSEVGALYEHMDYQVMSSNLAVDSFALEVNRRIINIITLPDFTSFRHHYNESFMDQFMQRIDSQNFNLIVTHNIEGIESLLVQLANENKVQFLVVSGHTHGVQLGHDAMAKYLLGNQVTNAGYNSALIAGLYRLGGKAYAHVSSGLGTSKSHGVRARLFRPPEVNLLTLKKS